LKAGRARSKKDKDEGGIKDGFLKTDEVSNAIKNNARLVFLLPAPAGFASPSLPTGEGAAKTTTESTT